MNIRMTSCIQDYVYDYARSIGVSVILYSKKVSGMLDYYSLDWIGTDGVYYSLFVPANDTQVFAARRMLIGEYHAECCLASNLRYFSTKKEWLGGRWDPDFAGNLELKLIKSLSEKCSYRYDACGYSVCGVVFATRPALSISVVYRCNTLIDSFTLTVGSKMCITDDVEKIDFLKKVVSDLGCCKWVELRVSHDGG